MDILQPTHIILILLVALLVLGPKRLPEVGKSLGRGLRDFKAGISGVQDEARGMFSDALDDPSELPEETAVAVVPEPPAPVAAEPVPVRLPTPAPPVATATKVAPVEPDPADYAD